MVARDWTVQTPVVLQSAWMALPKHAILLVPFLMHMSTALPELRNLNILRNVNIFPFPHQRPGGGADLVVPSDWGDEDPGGGGEAVGGGDGRSGVSVEVHVLGPAGDGPGPALGPGPDVVVGDDDLVAGSDVGGWCGGGPLDLGHEVLGGGHLVDQIGDLLKTIQMILSIEYILTQ